MRAVGHAALAASSALGRLAHEALDPGARQQALHLVLELLDGDAASLVSYDWDGTHRTIACHSYPDQVSDCLAGAFAVSRWQHQVLASALPPSISTEQDQSFRQGWIYQDVIEPAGFRDGVSSALRLGPRYVGAVHVSSRRERQFDDQRRLTLSALAESLAMLVDTAAPVLRRARVSGSDRACLVVDGAVVAVPGWEQPASLADPALQALVAAFARRGRGLSLLWPTSRTVWARLWLQRHRDALDREVVVVREKPVDPPFALTPRELDVLTRVALGLTNDAIAADLVLSPRTVHTHLEHILEKTATRTRAQTAALAVRHGLLRPNAALLAHDTVGILDPG